MKKIAFLLVLPLLMTVACAKETTPPDDSDMSFAFEPSPIIETQAPEEPETTAIPASAPTPRTFPTEGYIAKEGVNLREEPNADAAIVDILGQNAPIIVTALQDGWYRVNLDGQTAFAAEALVALGDPPKPHNMRWGKIIVKESQLYKTPDGASLSEVKLKEGDVVRILREIDGYLHVVYNKNLQRYVNKKDVEYISQEDALAALPTPTPRPLLDQPGA